MPTTLRDALGLRRLTNPAPRTRALRADAIRLEIPGIRSDERRRSEAKLNQHLGSCGCEGGAVALLSLGCVYAGLRLVGIRIPGGAARECGTWIALATAVAAIGKSQAQRRSQRLLLGLQAQVERDGIRRPTSALAT